MIRIIKRIIIQSQSENSLPIELSLFPGSGTLEETSACDERGRLVTYELKAVLMRDELLLRESPKIHIYFDNGEDLILGDTEIPIIFEISKSNNIKIKFKYTIPEVIPYFI